MANRTVSVGLELETRRYIPEAAKAERATSSLEDEVDELGASSTHTASALTATATAAVRLGASADRAENQVDELADQVGDVGASSVTAAAGMTAAAGATGRFGSAADRALGQIRGLSRQIDHARVRVRALAAEVAEAPDDIGLAKRFRAEQRQLAHLKRVREELVVVVKQTGVWSDALEDVAEAGVKSAAFSFKRLFEAFEALPMRLKGIAIVAGVGIGAALSPFLGGAIASAIVGSVGVGGVVGGMALAAQDERVQTYAGKIAKNVAEAWKTEAATTFVRPTLDALKILGDAAARAARNIRWEPVAAEIAPLATGLSDLVTNIMPGLNTALARAAPLLRVLARAGARLGDALGDALDTISRESDGVILGLSAMLDLIEAAIRGTADFIAFLARGFEAIVRASAAASGAMEDVWGWIPGVGDAIRSANDHQEQWLRSLEMSAIPLSGIGEAGPEAFRATGAAADAARRQIRDMFSELQDGLIGLTTARIDIEESLDELTASIKENGRTLDINTEKGRNNARAVLAAASAYDAFRDEQIQMGVDVEVANQAFGNQINALITLAVKAGLPRKQVEALLAGLRLMPPAVTTEFRVPGLDSAKAKAAEYKRIIGGIPGTVETVYRVKGTNIKLYAKGGIEPAYAQHGMITDRPTVVFAEAGMKEGFLPERGISDARAYGLLSEMASWYGMSVNQPTRYVPGTASTSGATAPPAAGPTEVHVYIGDREITDIVDVRITAHDRTLKRRVGAGAGTR